MHIHHHAARLLSIYGDGVTKRAQRRSIMRDCARRAVSASDDRFDQKRLDYREWRPDWDWSMPLMIGSGRASSWCHAIYRWRACVCHLLHSELGWSGGRVRRMADWLTSVHSGGNIDHTWRAPEEIPTEYVDRLFSRSSASDLSMRNSWVNSACAGGFERPGIPSSQAVAEMDWRLWLRTVADPAWGRLELARIAYRLDHDPTYMAPAESVGTIRAEQSGDLGHDLRGCSGCEWLSALADRPDLWNLFLARAPEPVRGKLGPIEGVIVQHGLAAPAGFDHCLVLCLNYSIYVRSTEFEIVQHEPARRLHGPISQWRFEAVQ